MKLANYVLGILAI